MLLDIDEERLAGLFPAFLHVDGEGSILAYGPSIARQMSGLMLGSKFDDHFSISGAVDIADFAELARTGALLELKSHDNRVILSGSLLTLEPGYLLALRHSPPSFSLMSNELQISDFGPDDPSVAGMLLVGLQQAMIEESREIALELGIERQRSMEMYDRFSRVSSYMAHDFNNLLSIIQLNADRIAVAAGSSSRTKRLAEMITETTQRGSEITSSLMTLSHQRQDSRIVLELDKLIRDNFSFFQTIVGTRIKIEYTLNAGGKLVEVNRIGLLNSMINLIVNARDAMAGSGLLQISTLAGTVGKPLPCDHIAIVIRDSGQGMTEDILTNAFKPMFSNKPTGNGMGLASVLEFVNAMGGEVQLESAPGKGTSCFIYLPETKQSAEMLPRHESVVDRDTTKGCRNASRIVLVEDEPFALEALIELLEAQGYEVEPCANAEEARAALATSNAQVLLSDVVLPDDSGIHLANQACTTAPDLRVILMSGYVPEFETFHAEWQFIRKPLDCNHLCEMIASALADSEPAA